MLAKGEVVALAAIARVVAVAMSERLGETKRGEQEIRASGACNRNPRLLIVENTSPAGMNAQKHTLGRMLWGWDGKRKQRKAESTRGPTKEKMRMSRHRAGLEDGKDS